MGTREVVNKGYTTHIFLPYPTKLSLKLSNIVIWIIIFSSRSDPKVKLPNCKLEAVVIEIIALINMSLYQ